MTRRWSYWHILLLIFALVPPSLILLSPTVFNPSLVNLIDTSTGSSLAQPEVEPTGADLGSAENLIGEDTTRSFDVIAQIQPDHSVVITEKITQVFRTERHGIERSIPIEYSDLGSHVIRAMQISTSEGTPNSLEMSDIVGTHTLIL